MKKIQNVEGNYSSTYSFVQKNKLEKVANKLFGKGWEAEDDVNQIEEIILAMNIGRHSVECIEEISADNDDILVRKVSDFTINIDKAFKQLISLYDICDDLENSGEDKSAKKTRATLNKLGAFIQSLKN